MTPYKANFVLPTTCVHDTKKKKVGKLQESKDYHISNPCLHVSLSNTPKIRAQLVQIKNDATQPRIYSYSKYIDKSCTTTVVLIVCIIVRSSIILVL